MRLRKPSLALATAVVALAAVGAVDNASAGFRRDELRGILLGETTLRAPQPNQNLPGATSRPSNRDMRGMPYMGGRGMRGTGGGRMNGGKGRR
jgi:hypothetical protein